MSDNPNFVPMYSTNNIYRDGDDTICLEDELDIIEADIATLETNKADNDHTHTGYVSQADLDLLADIVDTKANMSHTHSNYVSLVNGKVPISQIPSEVKEVRFANTIAERNAMTDLFVGLTVIVVDATGDSTVSSGSAWYVYTGYGWAKTAESESMDVVLSWADIQNKPATFAPSEHSHSNYLTQSDLELLEDVIDTKADVSHSHSNYSETTHQHSEYATQVDLDTLESEIDSFVEITSTYISSLFSV